MKRLSKEWWQSLPPEKTGKETEKLVENLFKKWNENSIFSWHRLPDAKASRGFLAAQPADYVWWRKPYGGYLEVKACNHEFRIAKDKVRQLPLLHKHSLAGASCFVLINHYLFGTWRVVNADSLPLDVPSWDLSGFPLHDTAEAALKSTGYF